MILKSIKVEFKGKKSLSGIKRDFNWDSTESIDQIENLIKCLPSFLMFDD